MILFSIWRKSVISLYNSRIAAFLFLKIFKNMAFSSHVASSPLRRSLASMLWERKGNYCLVLVLLWPRISSKPSWFHIIDSIVGVCSSNSLATRWGIRNLMYILAFILLNLLTTSTYTASFSVLPTSPLTSPLLTSSSILAVLIAKAGHVWVSWPEEFLLYNLTANIATGLRRLAYTQPQLISTK